MTARISSKKFANNCHALALYFAHYNFVKIHSTLCTSQPWRPALRRGLGHDRHRRRYGSSRSEAGTAWTLSQGGEFKLRQCLQDAPGILLPAKLRLSI
jgi:hypothetical protein